MKAVYAGTFDPWTLGHSHVLSQAIQVFDVTLAIGINPAKKPLFPLATRLEFLRDVAQEYNQERERVVASTFEGLYAVNYAESIGANFIIRGIRNPTDFQDEYTLSQINHTINPNIRTVFFMADREYADISSSVVKGMIGPAGWEQVVKHYVAPSMWDRFITEVKK